MINAGKFGAVLILALALMGCLSDKEQQQQGAAPPPLVVVHTIVARDTPYPAEYQAITQGSRAVEVRARVQAVIEKRLYTEGDYVKEGQQLFQLERDTYEAAQEQAQAQYNRAQREWNRVRPLYEKNAVSQKERDSARAAYESAKASLRSAEINLGYCQVVSPVSGYTGKEALTAGNLVSNGSLLTSVNQTDPLYVNFSIPGTDRMQRLHMASKGLLVMPADGKYKATIRLVDGSMYDKEGLVTFVDTQISPTMGVVKARAEFSNPGDAVLPGQYVRLRMEGDVLKDAILIPQRCVLITQQGPMVMVVGQDNVVQIRPITIGVTLGTMYSVTKGLKDGERVILEGLVKARPGQPVRVDDGKGQQGQPAGAASGKPDGKGAGKE